MQEMVHATKELEDFSNELMNMVEQFKVGMAADADPPFASSGTEWHNDAESP
jgi:hypothetical protein